MISNIFLLFFFKNVDRKSNSVSIDDIVTLVKGGIPYSSSGLLVIRNPDTYRNWGATLKYNPALINYEVKTPVFYDKTQD